MEKIVVNKDSCIGCGLCVHAHPEYMIFDDMGQAQPLDKEVKSEDKKEILQTVDNCPTEAFRVEDIKE